MLNKTQMVALLGRSLTSTEDTNFDLYFKIATEHLEEMLCISICKSAGERTYVSRDGYRTVYVDPFTEVNSITINGTEVSEDDYSIKQNDNFNGSWYNILEFDRKRCGEKIVVDAEWGFGKTPKDLQMILALLFNQVSVDQKNDGQVKSKKIEDFSVTYKDSVTLDDLLASNASVISKYSQCNQGIVRHGRVQTVYHQ